MLHHQYAILIMFILQKYIFLFRLSNNTQQNEGASRQRYMQFVCIFDETPRSIFEQQFLFHHFLAVDNKETLCGFVYFLSAEVEYSIRLLCCSASNDLDGSRSAFND